MARTEIAIQNLAWNGIIPSFVNADATNDMMFENDGNTVLQIKNAGTVAVNVTIVSVPDVNGRLGDISLVVGVGETKILGNYPIDLFNQSTNMVHVNFDTSASVTVNAFRL